MTKTRPAVGLARRMAQKTKADRPEEMHQELWHFSRRYTNIFVESTLFKAFIGSAIGLNTCLVVYETDLFAFCEASGSYETCASAEGLTSACNRALLTIYGIEVILRIYALRREYFSPSDIFDALIVFGGVFIEVFQSSLPGVGIFRLFRLVRVAKALKATTSIDEVKVFISGIGCAFRAIIVGAALIFFVLFVFSISAVMLLNPGMLELDRAGVLNNCERCALAYSSVARAMLTLLQTIVMGDAWGDFAVPLIEHQPWTSVVFVFFSFSISLGLTNLILAVIVDAALEHREINVRKEAQQRIIDVTEARQKFTGLCREIDSDKNGSISLEELLEGYKQDLFWSYLTLLDISEEDLECVFMMMDKDKSGEVSYHEFAHQLQALKSQDMHTMVAFVKFYVYELHALQTEFHRWTLDTREHWEQEKQICKEKTEDRELVSHEVPVLDRRRSSDAGTMIHNLLRGTDSATPQGGHGESTSSPGNSSGQQPQLMATAPTPHGSATPHRAHGAPGDGTMTDNPPPLRASSSWPLPGAHLEATDTERPGLEVQLADLRRSLEGQVAMLQENLLMVDTLCAFESECPRRTAGTASGGLRIAPREPLHEATCGSPVGASPRVESGHRGGSTAGSKDQLTSLGALEATRLPL